MASPFALDDTDAKILRLLETDARRTYGNIGAGVGLSAPAVKRRIDRLEEAGVVLGYTTVLNHEILGTPLQAFTELRFTGNARVDEIAHVADDIPEVEAVFTIAGDPDALAWMRVRDVHHLKQTVDRVRSKEHVIGTKTLIVLGTSQPRGPAIMA